MVYILSTSPGSLFAVLRHPNDRYVNPPKSTTVEDVLQKTVSLAPRLPASAPAPEAPPAPAPQRALPTKRAPRF
ncbi:MAG: hypothetical protein NDI61_09650 [Bdellovibrionaceae bacterium]|nr:hypothetical protein [Pseudobdellovibrionaceae bacterium]